MPKLFWVAFMVRAVVDVAAITPSTKKYMFDGVTPSS